MRAIPQLSCQHLNSSCKTGGWQEVAPLTGDASLESMKELQACRSCSLSRVPGSCLQLPAGHCLAMGIILSDSGRWTSSGCQGSLPPTGL
ncbi:hypothetical protein Q8A67_020219 [Cirrhinus molitorella]|uniref:Uncharacterized protein n=1 Tax=Cirrhinus molitorella TaxID=172907 RepID=A0AA88TCN4_9TELE|nr:hypothetical protein Q8A67_020219 [Cirrhinus molitorella]